MIHFIHHGQSLESKRGEFSKKDTSLSTYGAEVQGRDLGKLLLNRGVRPGLVVSSSLPRAKDFSRVLARNMDYDPNDIQVDPRFDEYDVGNLAGKSYLKMTPSKFEHAKGREDPNAFFERIRDGWNEYCQADRRTEGDTLIVSHHLSHLMLNRALDGGDVQHFYDEASFADEVPINQLPPYQTYAQPHTISAQLATAQH